jgi:hypothetical protein
MSYVGLEVELHNADPPAAVPTVKTEEMLPSGGLALPRETASAASTPGKWSWTYMQATCLPHVTRKLTTSRCRNADL